MSTEMTTRPAATGSPSRKVWKFILGAVLLGVMAAGSYTRMQSDAKEKSFAGVGITGMQHMGPNFNIATFYVNGYNGSNVGRGGGGSSLACCVLLPKVWRPGLTVELRWEVGDWSKENTNETDAGNYKSLAFQDYKARVPVEKYATAERLFVHFYAGGKARVVSGPPGPDNPIPYDEDPHAADSATAGTPVDSLYTEEELAAMRRKIDEERRKSGGGSE